MRTLGQLRWRVWLFIAIVIGFILACLGSAITTLQRPAGPLLCSRGDFVAGNVSEHFGGTTAYNIDSACITGGVVRHLSQTVIIGVLWVEYAPPHLWSSRCSSGSSGAYAVRPASMPPPTRSPREAVPGAVCCAGAEFGRQSGLRRRGSWRSELVDVDRHPCFATAVDVRR